MSARMQNVRNALMIAMTIAAQLPLRADAQTVVAAVPADVASPEAVVKAIYETFNRRPGENFDWDRLRSLHLPGAMLIPARQQTDGKLRVMTVEDFIAWIDEQTTVGGTNDVGFQEEEIAQRIERYGDIAQVFSTYHKHFWGESKILGRGINSIQLIRNDGRWWITSVAWDEEASAGPLPAKYLPR